MDIAPSVRVEPSRDTSLDIARGGRSGATPVRTTCAYCGVGCGVLATPTGPRTATIAGDPQHPANRGKLCSKGTHLGETIGLEGRLLHPMIGDQRADWTSALDLVAAKFKATIAEHGPDSVAFYVSGQLLTEDYYVANKLMKGFIGSGNIDTNSRLCMSSAVAAHIRAFGEDVVPASYDDLDAADLIVLVGSNTAWCHPIVWQRIERAREARGTKLVVIDPRRTETAEGADLHLAIRPDGDVPLFNGLLAHCRQQGLIDVDYLANHVDVPEGFRNSLVRHPGESRDPWTGMRREVDPGFRRDDEEVAEAAGISVADLHAFYRLFAAHPRTVTLFSQGANQSRCGTDKGNAIINVHLATGRIGKPGAAPFSITGQPNAMGGREVGGLASTLAAHMDFAPENVDRVGRFWNAPAMATKPGLKAVDLFQAINDGKVKALWVMATNPAVSMPNAGAVRAALAKCPFVVVSDVIADTDTGRFAHVRLPAEAWAEKDGTVTNSDRTISRQRGFLPAPGEARADWRIIAQVAQLMGWAEDFAWENAAAVFREHAALTAFENDGARKLDLGAQVLVDNAEYDALEPFVWGGASPFADGRYSHAGGRARLVLTATSPQRGEGRGEGSEPEASIAPSAFQPLSQPSPQWGERAVPVTINTGRYRDQWHTMTRTGLSPRLSQHRREPLADIHPSDAALAGIADGDLVRVATAQGRSVFRAAVTDAQRPGEVFVPIHWTDRTSGGGRTGLLPSNDVDPFSGQPGFKNTSGAIQKVEPEWKGFLLTRDEAPGEPECLWWAKVRVAGGWLFELAGDGDPAALETLLPQGERVEMVDARRGTLRAATVADGHVRGALFVARDGRLPPRDWLVAQLGLAEPPVPAQWLAGRPAQALPDRGPVVCACFDVGMMTILEAVAEQSLTSVAAVGAALGAGTNCGSCRPAIARLLAQTEMHVAAE